MERATLHWTDNAREHRAHRVYTVRPEGQPMPEAAGEFRFEARHRRWVASRPDTSCARLRIAELMKRGATDSFRIRATIEPAFTSAFIRPYRLRDSIDQATDANLTAAVRGRK